MRAHALILDEAIGLAPSKSEAENMKAMEQYFDMKDEDNGYVKRQEVEKALEHLDVEFYAHGAEVGWFYDLDYEGTFGGATPSLKDWNPQIKVNGDMELCTYNATMRPGSQLPHASLIDKATGKRLSTRDLVSRDKLLLLSMWPLWGRAQLAHPLIDARIVDEADNDSPESTLSDTNNDLKRIWQQELTATGALLIRPDNIIGYLFIDDYMLQVDDQELNARKPELSDVVRKVLWLSKH